MTAPSAASASRPRPAVCSSYADAGSAGDRSVVVARDLTEQLRLNATIRDLVANVSHELRTPLTAIRGYAENLNEGALEQPRVAGRFVDRILAQCRRLEALLEDLLALSRIERAEEIPAAAVKSFDRPRRTLAEWALETVRGLAEERRIELIFEARPVPTIAGSEEALETMLLNLLENAIKYNREGGSVTLALSRAGTARWSSRSPTPASACRRRDLPRIFERFYRVDRGRSRSRGRHRSGAGDRQARGAAAWRPRRGRQQARPWLGLPGPTAGIGLSRPPRARPRAGLSHRCHISVASLLYGVPRVPAFRGAPTDLLGG